MTLLAGAAMAGTAQSPLDAKPDAVGALLQKSFVAAPAGEPAAARGSFSAYRKTFVLDSPPRTAVLHLFADARYMLWINGSYVQRGPSRFEIRGPQYDSLDVAKYLRRGRNTVAILVMANDGKVKAIKDGMGLGHNAKMMAHVSGLTASLEVDGSTALKSDTTWKWNGDVRYRPAKIDWAKIVDSIDARVEDGDWTRADYDDTAWKSPSTISGDAWGPLSANCAPMLRETPVEISFDGSQKLPVTLEAGQELKFTTGRLVLASTVLEMEAEEGTELSLGYAGINYIARAGRQVYVSSDTCAFDRGSIKVKSGKAKILDFHLVERLYPFDVVGRFHSSDPLLNRIWDVCVRGLLICSEDAYVDCADRERAEWMDCDPPAFDVTRVALAGPGPAGRPAYSDPRLLGQMLRRTALTAQKDGWVKAHTSSDRFDIHAHMEDRSCDWIQGARRYYESTGDAALIREIWPAIVGQLDYFLARRTERGLVLAREWVVWGNPVGYVTCEGAGINAFVYKALVDAAFLGAAIGKNQESSRFAGEAQKLAKAFNAVLWDESEGAYFSGYYSQDDRAKASGRALQMKLKVENDLIEPTMFAALWALDQGIVPEDRLQRVTEYLLKNRNQAQRTMTYYYLFKQMYGADTEEFDREILATIRDKWKPQAESPWHTTWEELTGSSKAHIYGIHPAYFLSAYVLGVRAEMPASTRRLLIEPHLGDLEAAEGVVVTEHGPVPVSWKQKDGVLDFHVEIPAGTTATLRVPHPGPSGKLVINGKTPAVREAGRFIEISLDAGAHKGLISKLR